MRINELFEALDSSYPYKVANGSYYFNTDSGEQYKVVFKGDKKVEVSFMARGENDQPKDNITGTGDSRKVFGTVMNIVKDYVDSYHPDILFFAAVNSEPSRIRLYNALAAKANSALPGYSFAKTLKDKAFTVYYITRDGLKVPKIDTAKNVLGRALDTVFEEELNETEVLGEITRPKTIDRASLMLYKAGYSKIGSGAYAEVYGKPGDNHVLKLFAHNDYAYQKFINMVIQNPNQHFPSFKGKMMKITPEYYAIRTELLDSLTGDYIDILAEIRHYIYDCIEHGKSRMIDINKLEKMQPGIAEACDLLVKFIKGTTASLDLHKHNAMLRGNTIVFIDPVQ